jgi:hypothetical protein
MSEDEYIRSLFTGYADLLGISDSKVWVSNEHMIPGPPILTMEYPGDSYDEDPITVIWETQYGEQI